MAHESRFEERLRREQRQHSDSSHRQEFFDIFPGEESSCHDGDKHQIAQSRKLAEIHPPDEQEAPDRCERDQDGSHRARSWKLLQPSPRLLGMPQRHEMHHQKSDA